MKLTADRSVTSKRLRDAMSRADIRASELARITGINKASISQYLKGSHTPSNFSAAKIAPILRVSPVWLMGFDVPMDPSEQGRSGRKKVELRRQYPILDGVSGGKPVTTNGNRSNHVNNVLNIPADYVLLVEDPSMTGRCISVGDVLFIRSQEMISDGELMILSRDDRLLLKRAWLDDATRILSLADDGDGKPEIILPENQTAITVIGRVIAVQHAL
ncbi:MAG: helix-turn-helix transcriptional regulator [Lachnospiraceae bacterium]|nr:helix-turn-helix transcriptional regulator [Lachnospiraceae bacterium]